ncbi:hypothetical protein RRG08_027593 [Elysia crispata]|uniref:Uncharacterized protein n=1 Tax=Elysia crispata TaxID=231223 RepID=A0AAE1AG43_9GAST|nr:hypothetical protein RRG08_027593 [Elysia crispata]
MSSRSIASVDWDEEMAESLLEPSLEQIRAFKGGIRVNLQTHLASIQNLYRNFGKVVVVRLHKTLEVTRTVSELTELA